MLSELNTIQGATASPYLSSPLPFCLRFNVALRDVRPLIATLQNSILGPWRAVTQAGASPARHQTISSSHVHALVTGQPRSMPDSPRHQAARTWPRERTPDVQHTQSKPRRQHPRIRPAHRPPASAIHGPRQNDRAPNQRHSSRAPFTASPRPIAARRSAANNHPHHRQEPSHKSPGNDTIQPAAAKKACHQDPPDPPLGCRWLRGIVPRRPIRVPIQP